MGIVLLVDAFVEYELDVTLAESKGLHSLQTTDDLRQSVIDAGFDMDKGKFKHARRMSSIVGNRQFQEIFDRTKRTLTRYTRDYLEWKAAQASGDEKLILAAPRMAKTRWIENVKRILRDSYQQSFDAGFASSGVTKRGVARPVRVKTSKADEDWVRTAFLHEMRYFNKLLKDIERGAQSGTIEKRMGAYAETLKHIFYAGKVMGTPSGMIVDWISPLDRNTCTGCRFLAENSPFTKDTLPSTPRAGDTPCLNRCRCRLVMRDVGKERFEAVRRAHRSKEWYRRRLSALKDRRVLV